MDYSLKEKAIYAALCIAISFCGIYYFMIQPLNAKAKAEIKAQLESPTYGPFDEALAKSAGLEHLLKEKPKRILPVAKPLTFGSDWSNQFPTSDAKNW